MKEFFEALFPTLPPDQAIHLRWIAPKWMGTKKVNKMLCQTPQIASETAEMKKRDLDPMEMFFGVSPRTESRGFGASSVTSTQVLWTDIDFKDTHEKDAHENIRRLDVAPNIVISSGHGLHLYWLLDHPQEDLDHVESCNRFLSSRLGADHCWDRARLMRIPDTVNWKDPRKPRWCRILKFTPNRTSLNMFDTLSLETSPGGGTPSTRPSLSFHSGLSELRRSCGPLWCDYVQMGAAADVNGFYGSRSELDFAVVRKLFQAGYDEDSIFAIMTDPQYAISDKYFSMGHDGDRYMLRTIGNARRFAH